MISKLKISSSLMLLLLLSARVFSQTYETRNFDIPDRKKTETLSEAEKKEPVVLVEDNRTYEFANNPKEELELYYTRHVRIHLNEQSAVEGYNKIYIPVNTADDLVTLHARTLTKDGKSSDMLKGDMKLASEEGQNFMILAVEGLEKDAELEYFYTSKSEPRLFLTERMQSHAFTRSVTLNVISKDFLVFDVKTYNAQCVQKDTVKDGKRWVSVKATNLSPLDDEEKYSIYRANVFRAEIKLAKNTTNSNNRLYTWNDAGGQIYKMFHAKEKSDDKEIEKLIKKQSFGQGNQEEQVNKIERFMKSTIAVQQNQEEESIKSMLTRRYASTNQVIRAYVQLFEALNIPYEIVVTCDRMNAPFDPDFDTWNYLDEYLFYFPFSKKYLDPTNPIFRYGMIPAEYTGNHGLFVKNLKVGDVVSGVASVKFIDPLPASMHNDDMLANISLSADLSKTTIQLERSMTGYGDNNIRAIYYYSNEEDRKKLVEGFVQSEGGEGAEVSNIKVSNFDLNSDEYNKPFIITAQIESGSLLEQAGSTVLFRIGQVIGQQVEMYQDHARQNPIDQEFCHSYNRILNFKIPDGYSVKGLEKLNIDITTKDGDSPVMGFVSSYKLEGSQLSITVKEYYNKTHLPASSYDAFRKVINAAADFNKIKLILEKK